MEQNEAMRLAGMLGGRDLTDPVEGAHPLQSLVTHAHQTVAELWGCPRRLLRLSPLEVDSGDGDRRLRLRRHVFDALPRLLSALALDPPEDVLLVAPGQVLPSAGANPEHQLALLRLVAAPVGSVELGRMLQAVIRRLLPDRPYRLLPERDTGLLHAMRIECRCSAGWLEVGRCGMVRAPLLLRAGLLPDRHRALVLGLGLERVLGLADGGTASEQPAQSLAC